MSSITQLAESIKGDVVTPDHDEYSKAIARWAKNAERKAAIVVFVKDVNDIILALEYAKVNKLAIAVRGGGHSPGGASSIEGGLVIDLSRYFNGARVDPEARLAYVGGGALWEVVDKTAIKHGLATVAGTVNHTGVGGLTLGGGYGFLSSAHGMVVDNLTQVTIVTANGSVLVANKDQNTDLFYAVRGGGGNFGIVTEFVLQLHPQRSTVYTGPLIFPGPCLEKLIEVTNQWWETAGDKEGMLQALTTSPDEHRNPIIVVLLFYNGTEAEGRENYKRFFDLGPVVDGTKEFPFEELNSLQNPMAPHGQGVYMKGSAHQKAEYQTISKVHQKVVELTKSSGMVNNVVLEWFPLSKVSAISPNTTAFRRDGNVPSILIVFTWDQEKGDKTDQARTHTYETLDILKHGQIGMSAEQSLGYSNYDFDGSGENGAAADRAKLVFGHNYPRLQQIKKIYDPDNIFNKWFPIVPA